MKILIIALSLSMIGCASKTKKVVRVNQDTAPAITESRDLVMIDHKYFKISYNTERRLAQYVTYQLTADQLRAKNASREDKFIPDPLLKKKNIPYVLPSEYIKTGYDRGHLAPSADFSWDQQANDMTFVMSNMVPQKPKLNRDAWKRLEDKVRKWACGEEKITVVTGPILVAGLPRLKSGLEIPQHFFKIIIDETPPKKIISFIYHQEDKGDVLAERMVPMNKVESSTGVAFSKTFPIDSIDARRPASLNEWKEADCH